jgi:hypothetical protein
MDSQLAEEVPIASPMTPPARREPSTPSEYHRRHVIWQNSQHKERRRRLEGRLFLVLVLFVVAVLVLLSLTHVGVMFRKNLNPNRNFWVSSSVHPDNVLVPRDDNAVDGQPGEYCVSPTFFDFFFSKLC